MDLVKLGNLGASGYYSPPTMNRPSYGDNAPIVALATPPGESALALIRCSGAGTLELLAHAFSRPQNLRSTPGNTILHGWIVDQEGEKIDDVLLSVYRAPRSYTGEEGADISCHGGPATVKATLETLETVGFRMALPGEFTFRAFMNGKLDLTRSESVMDLVAAKTDEGRRHALGRLQGQLAEEIGRIKDLLIRALAAAELFLDYSEDDGVSGIASEALDDEAAGRMPDRTLVQSALAALEVLAAGYGVEKLYRDGALVAIAGPPNAGKSSLFNRLLKEERSIVTDIPGTTRDWIESWIAIKGIPIRLVDTAGLRTTDDPVEIIGVERSRSVLQDADLVVYVLDGEQGPGEEDLRYLAEARAERRAGIDIQPIVAWNKCDLGQPPINLEALGLTGIIPVSALTGAGIGELADRIAGGLTARAAGAAETVGTAGQGIGGPAPQAEGQGAPFKEGRSRPGVASERQKKCLDRAIQAVGEALSLADRSMPLDLIAPELREAVGALGEITGEVSTADILEAMFSRFCVGK